MQLSESVFLHRLSAEAFSTWLSQQTKVPFRYTTPRDYSAIATRIGMALLFAAFAFHRWSYIQPVLLGKTLWAFASLAVILLMISGMMWNQIRRPPYMVPGQQGGANLIAGGYSNQFGVETHILSGLCL